MMDVLPGKSFRDPMEAWWKHEGKNRCAILTIRAQAGLGDRTRNWRKPRKNSRSCAIVHGSFDTTHNLKVVGSNPTPATKNTSLIKDFNAEHNARLYSFRILVNTWSTFYEAPFNGADNRAEPGNHAAALHAGSSQAQISAVTSASGRPSRAVPPE